MKHIETQPVKKQTGSGQSPKKRSLSVIHASLLALLFVGGIGFGMTHWWDPLPVDRISDKEKSELVDQFTRVRSIAIEQVKDQSVDVVLDSMHLDPKARLAMKQTLNNPSGATTVLAQIVLWDFAAQDGDIVRVSSAGYEIEVPLMNEPKTITIPVDSSRELKLSGVYDGGGGITLGIQSGPGKISLPVITEGQVLSLPLSL